MIAITGATGNLGKLAITHLLKRVPANQLVAIVRNVSKAQDIKKLGVEVREANYDDSNSWGSALKGINDLLLISSSEVGKRFEQHKNVIEGAKGAGVSRVVYTSLLRADTSKLALATEHIATEELIKKSGLNYTILRNGWYIENHTENLASALEHGAFLGAAKEGRFSSSTRSDYAEAAAVVLTNPGHNKKIYELAGNQSYTLNDLITKVSALSGKKVVYQDLGFENYKNTLIQVGLPEGFATILADSDAGAALGELFSESKDLSNLIGHQTTTLEEKLKTLF